MIAIIAVLLLSLMVFSLIQLAAFSLIKDVIGKGVSERGDGFPLLLPGDEWKHEVVIIILIKIES